MSPRSLSLLKSMMESPTFVDMVEDFVAAEAQKRLQFLREKVRDGERDQAIREEAELTAIESLPRLMREWAAKSE